MMSSKTKVFALKSAWLGVILSGSLLTGASVSHLQEPAASQTAPAGDHPEFPAGSGRDVTLATCSKCHSPNNILSMGRDRQGWQDLISKMVDLGAQGSDEDFSAILDYLTKSFPAGTATHINVNTASAPQMVAALALSPEDAKQIVDYRDKNGKYKTMDDLRKVPKVDQKKLEASKDAVTF